MRQKGPNWIRNLVLTVYFPFFLIATFVKVTAFGVFALVHSCVRVTHMRKLTIVYSYFVDVSPDWKTFTEVRNEIDISEGVLTSNLEYLLEHRYVELRVARRERKELQSEDQVYVVDTEGQVIITFFGEFSWTGKPMKRRRRERRTSPLFGRVRRAFQTQDRSNRSFYLCATIFSV